MFFDGGGMLVRLQLDSRRARYCYQSPNGKVLPASEYPLWGGVRWKLDRDNNNSMENKKTTELLEALNTLPEDGDDIWGAGGKYDKLMEEIKTRHPFYDIFNEDYEESLPSVWEAIKELQDEIKKLKRHKHDEKTGDVLIRI